MGGFRKRKESERKGCKKVFEMECVGHSNTVSQPNVFSRDFFSHKTHPKMTFAFLYLYKVRALKWHFLPVTSMSKFDSGVLVNRRERQLPSEEPCHTKSLLPSLGGL